MEKYNGVTLQSMLFHNTNQSIQNVIKFFSNIHILTRILMITKYGNGSKHYEKNTNYGGKRKKSMSPIIKYFNDIKDYTKIFMYMLPNTMV